MENYADEKVAVRERQARGTDPIRTQKSDGEGRR